MHKYKGRVIVNVTDDETCMDRAVAEIALRPLKVEFPALVSGPTFPEFHLDDLEDGSIKR